MPRSYGQLIPSVERRLTAWVSVVERQAGGGQVLLHPTITISRRFGCEGFPLSERLKELLEARTRDSWMIYDKALLEIVSKNENLSPDWLAGLGGPSRALDTVGFLVPGYTPHSQVFRLIPKHLLRIAEAGNAIIVGRGGAIITQRLPNCFHFRLDAPLEFRVASLARRMEIGETEAARLVRGNEKAREDFIEECLGVSPGDPALYDAVFNNARQGIAEIAAAIVAYVTESWQRRMTSQVPQAHVG